MNALQLDADARLPIMEQIHLHLTPLEVRVIAHSGQIVPYEALEAELWGPVQPYHRPRLRVLLSNLRRKFQDVGLLLELHNVKRKGMVLVNTPSHEQTSGVWRTVGIHSAA